MKQERNSIGVVVLEPNSDLLKKLCTSAMAVWGAHEVLPRQTGRQLRVAAVHLDVGVVVVRSSVQRSCPLIQQYLADLVARGSQLLVIQDTPYPLSTLKPVTVGKLHFFYNGLNEADFKALLTRCLIGQYMPSALEN